MIPLGGLDTRTAMRLTDATRETQLELIEKRPQHARAIDAFRARIADIKTPAALVEDAEVYGFVMRAFDLEDQIFGKAMVRELLESDIAEPRALINRLTDSRFREMYRELGYESDGSGSWNASSRFWQEKMVDRYVERIFINQTAEQNDSVATILDFRSKASDIDTWYDVLKDKDLSIFMRRALGIPDEAVQMDIDSQVAYFKRKFDLKQIADPAEMQKLERKYAIVTDALDQRAVGANAAVQMLSQAVRGRSGFVPQTIDITAISALPRRPYG
ncbi:DUF1217 domain-containing protein [Mesobaculum littorinae]|uniref:DUF1217 domain-containing protein n=1 Tax=Mesobaculum littorinae TaxID=2486419 RepID=A0A438ADV3_9RHOB|nr:DUF1217 domain-containing protein [Mesobaculum littorinae]RVV96871.1 DUF1217 domain-containing protein [Mesobaculum littorinae]